MPKKKRKGFRRSKKEWEESIAGHIGKTADNMKFNDWVELGVMAGIGVMSYEVFKDWKGPLFGLISYKLATTMGGTPPVSQIAGLTGLATMGLAYKIPEISEAYDALVEEAVKIPGTEVPAWTVPWMASMPGSAISIFGAVELKKLLGI